MKCVSGPGRHSRCKQQLLLKSQMCDADHGWVSQKRRKPRVMSDEWMNVTTHLDMHRASSRMDAHLIPRFESQHVFLLNLYMIRSSAAILPRSQCSVERPVQCSGSKRFCLQSVTRDAHRPFSQPGLRARASKRAGESTQLSIQHP